MVMTLYGGSKTNAKCLSCNMSWYEPIFIIHKCPGCNSNKITVDKLKKG